MEKRNRDESMLGLAWLPAMSATMPILVSCEIGSDTNGSRADIDTSATAQETRSKRQAECSRSERIAGSTGPRIGLPVSQPGASDLPSPHRAELGAYAGNFLQREVQAHKTVKDQIWLKANPMQCQTLAATLKRFRLSYVVRSLINTFRNHYCANLLVHQPSWRFGLPDKSAGFPSSIEGVQNNDLVTMIPDFES
ncbi:hypothetical protein V8F33_001936 [Rhypophila sp. PSN 637]